MADYQTDPRLKDALAADIVAVAERLGAKLKRKSLNEWSAACPKCGGVDRFNVMSKEGRFLCRGGDPFGAGDVVNMVRHCRGCGFGEALEWITGQSSSARSRPNGLMADQGNSSAGNVEYGTLPERAETAAGGDSPEAELTPEALDERARKAALWGAPAHIYGYVDEGGVRVYEKRRYEWIQPSSGAKAKTFTFRRPARPGDSHARIDRKDGWAWAGPQPGERAPYNLAGLQEGIAAGELVLIPEGEKKVDLLTSWGLTATCTDMGAGQWPSEINKFFLGADVVLLQDNDVQLVDAEGRPRFHADGRPIIPGRDHTQVVGRALLPYAKSVRVLEFPELPVKGDVYDWGQAGGTAAQLFERIEKEAKPWKPDRPGSNFGAMLFDELDAPGEEIEWLVDNVLTVGDRSILGGESQSGKTFLALHVAMCIATGMDFFGAKVKPGLVIYQAGESPKGAKKRMRAWRQYFGVPANRRIPMVLLTKKVDLFADRDACEKLIAEIKAWQTYFVGEPLRLVVIDTLAKASLGAEENSAKDMGIVLDNTEKIGEAVKTHVMSVHHMTATGKKLRGSTAIRANIDQVIFVNNDLSTKVRTVSIEKQKEDAEGEPLQFELLQVPLGSHADGKPITSCVCLPPGEKAEWRQLREHGYVLRDGPEHLAMQALLKARRTKGRGAPPDVEAPGMTLVVDAADWFAEYFKVAPYDNDDPRVREASAKKALKRIGARFLQYGLIAKDDKWIWLSGKPVRGFRETFPPEARAKAGLETAASEELKKMDIGDVI